MFVILVKVCLSFPLHFILLSYVFSVFLCIYIPASWFLRLWLILIILIVTSASFTQIVDAEDKPFSASNNPIIFWDKG